MDANWTSFIFQVMLCVCAGGGGGVLLQGGGGGGRSLVGVFGCMHLSLRLLWVKGL